MRIFADGKKPVYLIACQECPIDESAPEELLIPAEQAYIDRELYFEYQGDADYARLIAVCRRLSPSCRLVVVFPEGTDPGGHRVLFGRLNADSELLSLGLQAQAESASYRWPMAREQVGCVIIGRDVRGKLAS